MIRRLIRWLFNWTADDLLVDDMKLEQNLFSLWAFGYRTSTYSMDEFNAWNARHSDLLELKVTGNLNDDIRRMKALYLESKRLKGAKFEKQAAE